VRVRGCASPAAAAGRCAVATNARERTKTRLYFRNPRTSVVRLAYSANQCGYVHRAPLARDGCVQRRRTHGVRPHVRASHSIGRQMARQRARFQHHKRVGEERSIVRSPPRRAGRCVWRTCAQVRGSASRMQNASAISRANCRFLLFPPPKRRTHESLRRAERTRRDCLDRK
jgi:hypothetical protein